MEACHQPRAEKIKQDKDKLDHVRERAQAQADSWRAMMVLIREDGHEFEDTGHVMGGALTAAGAYPQMLCPQHREVMAFHDANAEAQRYNCPRGCAWEFDHRGTWPKDARRTGLTEWTQLVTPISAVEQDEIDRAFDEPEDAE